MNPRKLVVSVLFLVLCAAAAAKDAPRSFSLSTSRTFSPGESVKIQLFSRNVPEFEFRVYKVNDLEKFFAGLKDPHSFGEHGESPAEQIDQRTWLERIHDWKAHLWWTVRHFFRGQFTDGARDTFREQQGKLGKRSRIVGATQFAQIPILNQSQLVAKWKLQTPPAVVSETQQLPVEGLGKGVYLIEATDGTYKAYTVAVVTSIAVVERGGQGASLFVADRKTGAPVADADVVMWAGGKQQSSGKTDNDGLANLTMEVRGGEQGAEPENVWILARHGDDAALVTPWGYSFHSQNSNDLDAYVYTDRPVYRPGHTVHIKGIVRRDVNDTVVLPQVPSVTMTIEGGGKTVFEKDLPVSAHGTVTTDLNLESDAALGFYSIRLRMKDQPAGYGGFGYGNFEVQEYKKPEYQVTVKPAAQRIVQGNTLQAIIEARYFFGEPVPGAKVKYVVHTSTHYWWGEEDEGDDNAGGSEGEGSYPEEDDTYGATEQQEHEGVLDANGRLAISLPVSLDPKHEDQNFRIEARVTDAANREVSGHATVLATYGSFHINVEPVSYVVQGGQPVRVKVTAQDYDNKPVQTAVHLVSTLQKWDSVTHEYSKTTAATRDANTGADGTVLVDIPIGSSGDFKIAATAQTPEQRTVEGDTWVWVWNGAGQAYQENTQIQIVADKKSYQVGDTAHLLLVTGLKESWAVVTVEGNSVQSRRIVHGSGDSAAFDVPITAQSAPNVVVTAILVHDDQVATAQKKLKVPLTERTLTITATPDKQKYLPGETGTFDVFTADSNGNPVQADISFGEVDEALYSVRPDQSGDIVGAFYPSRYVYLQTQSSFEFYFSGQAGTKSPLLAELNTAAGLYHPRMSQVKPGSDLVMPKVRKAFPDTAYWNPNVRTGPEGHARVQFAFPDALTTWRTTVRAMTDDGKAGAMITRVLVRKNLIVRLAAPRFFRQGDETVLRVIAHNYLESAKEVTFALDMQGLDIIRGQTQKVTIPAKGESYVDWRVRSKTTGTATLTAKALTNEESDALEMTLPILPFGVKQRAAGTGVVYSGAGQNQWSFAYPAQSDAGTRGLTVTIAPSVAGTVFDALDYLTSYPWGCTEQTMSSFLPDLIVSEAVDKLHLKSPIDPKTLNDMVSAGIERLQDFQHDDGGWGWWPDDPSRVFMTAYVVSGLGQAKASHEIDKDKFDKGRAWLAKALANHPNMVPDLRAYVVYALATTGDAPKEAMNRAWTDRNKLTDEGLALLGLAFDAAGDARAKEAAELLEKKANVTDSDAHWDSNYDGLLEYWYDTSSETTAFALKLLVHQKPQSGLLSKSARWLAQHRDGDYWYTTKQTALVIEGLTDYLALSGELANESDVEVLVNGTSVGKRHFGPADAFGSPWRVKLSGDQVANGGQITIRKSGNGITYWSAENSWYSTDKRQYQKGTVALNITRDYYILQKKQDKPTDPITYDLAPLSGPVHIGDVIAVRLAIGGSSFSYVLAEDPIPAGTEFVPNASLYTLNHKPDWWADWFTRKEFHDDRAAFFNTEFSGRREYVYLLKVVNPGKFTISPAVAGPMYQPDTQTSSDPAALEVLP
ncbi:alpha-2-macroglobulin family protein [Occallatibacter riparius]|uniref:MG2 domain-containing protein n=1 Tax=Occallatibacter riparius TaxID=1002689 RepID=A0A9J7BIG0_9BACT|nr:alpha-2-macroglobulin family protein [Occallatibacter riparius]UWZ82281.1 MG2 domain-containing protein [Occallatibacter riparius]